jgi:hypothetical protein
MAEDNCRLGIAGELEVLDHETARDISEIALSYIDELGTGVSLDEAVSRTIDFMKVGNISINEVDVWNAMSGRSEAANEAKGKEMRDRKKELRKQAGLEARINELWGDMRSQIKNGKPVSNEEIDALFKEVDSMQKQLNKTVRETNARGKLQEELEAIKTTLADIRAGNPIPSEELQAEVAQSNEDIRSEIKTYRKELKNEKVILDLKKEIQGIEENESADPQLDEDGALTELGEERKAYKEMLQAEVKAIRKIEEELALLETELTPKKQMDRAVKGESPVNSQRLQVLIDALDVARAKRDAVKKEERAKRKEQKKVEKLEAKRDAKQKELETGEKEVANKKSPTQADSDRIAELKAVIAEIDAQIKTRNKIKAMQKRFDDRIKKKRSRLMELQNRKLAVKPSLTLPPNKITEQPKVIRDLNKKISDAMKELNADKAIEKVDENLKLIKDGKGHEVIADYKAKRDDRRQKQEEVSEELFEKRRKLAEKRREINDYISENIDKTVLTRAADALEETNNLLRGTILSGDVMGAGFRQLVLWTLNIFDPATSAKSFEVGFKSMMAVFQKNGYEKIQYALERHPSYIDALRSGLVIRGEGDKITASEEYTQSKIINMIPGLRGFIAYNDHVMTAYINTMTLHAYSINTKGATREEKKAIAKMINVSVGRGTIFGVEEWGRLGRLAFLSGRFAMGTIQAPHQAVHRLLVGSKAEKAFVMRTWGGYIAGGMTMTFLATLIPGVDMDDDIDSPTFGQIMWGDTRVNIWGPYYGIARMYMRIFTLMGRTAGVVRGEGAFGRGDATQEVAKFFTNRTSPLVNLFVNVGKGETKFKGMDYDDVVDIWSGKKAKFDDVDTNFLKPLFKGDFDDMPEPIANLALTHFPSIILTNTMQAYGHDKSKLRGGINASMELVGLGTGTFEQPKGGIKLSKAFNNPLK